MASIAVFVTMKILMSIGAVVTLPVELSVFEAGSAFFMRPSQPWRGNRSIQEWPMVALAGARLVRASYGPSFSHQLSLPASLLRQVAAGRGVAVSSRAVDGFGDVTAHFVTESVSFDRRELQVLFHVSHSTSFVEVPTPSTPRICILLYCRRGNGDELATSCTMIDGDTCIATMSVPAGWWEPAVEPRTLSAFFGAFRLEGNIECDVSRYPPLRQLPADDAVTFIRQVALVDGTTKYQTLREDQHVLLRVPLGTFHPGTKFAVGIQLQTGSKLAAFSVRVRCRVGVRPIGVENHNASRWRVTIDLNPKRQMATVTAYSLRFNTSGNSGADDVHDVFDWIFEVTDADAVRDDAGRLAFTIEYELASTGTLRGHVENKVAARVQIQPDTTYAIVPVVKTNEIVNTAILTGSMQSYPMIVYSISYAGHLADVTSQATCHSGDVSVLQVSESCGYVFLNGSESHSSASASIIVKYGRHARFLQFRVWTPELPLDVEVSDARLGRVVGWQVPDRIQINASTIATMATGSSTASTTPSDIKNPASLPSAISVVTMPTTSPSLSSHSDVEIEYQPICRTLYQSATVDVYARFVTTDAGRGSPPYMLHRKALFRLTDLLHDRIRLSDQSVARLRGGTIVEGLKPGRTEIQVTSRSGRILGTGELSVIDDTVIIDRLEVELVSGVELSVEAKSDFPGAIAAQVTKISRLQNKLQEAIVDVSLAFDDGTLFPLSALAHTSYQLVVDSLNTSVIARLPSTSSHPASPLLIATSSGHGDIVRVTLSPSHTCIAASKPSATKTATAHVDVTIADDAAQSDARIGNTDQSLRNPGETWGGKGGHDSANSVNRDHKKDPDSSHDALLLSGGSTAISSRQNRSLELAMYALLAIFGIALAVFTVNCLVFIVRRRHRRSNHSKESGSSTTDVDWIWIGHDALKRNAIGIECTRTLVPDVDFGVNDGPVVHGAVANGHVACVTDASPPPPPLPPKLGHPSAATLGLARGRSRNRSGCTTGLGIRTNAMEMQRDGSRPRLSAQDAAIASWHGRSSRSNTMSSVEWDCARLGVTSNQELIAYFDGLRESAA